MFLYLIIGVIVRSAILAFLDVSVTEQIAVPIPVGVAPGLRGRRHRTRVPRVPGYEPTTPTSRSSRPRSPSRASLDRRAPVHLHLVRVQLHRLLRGGRDVHRPAWARASPRAPGSWTRSSGCSSRCRPSELLAFILILVGVLSVGRLGRGLPDPHPARRRGVHERRAATRWRASPRASRAWPRSSA